MKNWYTMKAMGGQRAAIYVYGDVVSEKWYDEEVSANSFKADLEALGDVQAIDLHINSPGGNVFAGLSIYSLLRQHKARVTAYVDGVAASIAGVIMSAADEVLISEAGLIMVHNPWGMAIGDANELRRQADAQDKAKLAIIAAYQNRVAMTDDELSAIMDNETWITATEAIEQGWADAVIPAPAMVASVDLSRFNNPPKQFTGSIPAKPSNPSPEKPMTTKAEQSAATGGGQTIDVKALEARARKEALEADRKRREEIADVFSKFLPEYEWLMRKAQDDLDCTADMASKQLLDELGKKASAAQPAKKAEPESPVIESGEDERDKFRKGATAALMARSMLAKDDTANDYRGHTLLLLAQESLRMSGIRTANLSKMDMVAAAFTHTSDDFTNILANIANKAMLQGWDEQEETYPMWTRAGSLPDFKAAKRVDLNLFPALSVVEDGAEYKYATVGDRGESIQLATYGKMFAISRQTIINDDLDAFSRIPQRMGRAARRTVGNLVYAVLTDNAAMSDGYNLFSSEHKNLLNAAAINTTSVDAMRVKMSTQKDPDSHATGGLNIRLKYLLTPMALEGTAKVVRDSQFEVGASSRNNTTPNSVQGTFEVISDARLDTNSATVWYGATDPNMHDTIEVSYLDGNDQPFLDQMDGWTRDGTEFKVRIDAGVKALDFRGLAKNPYSG